jgi:HAD superfamily hydrolase (TIGR01509 family)
MIKGILFDMDGVLVDSEKFICEAAMQMFAEQCVYVEPDDFLPFVGTGESRYLGGVAEKYGYAYQSERDKTRTYDIYDKLVKGKLKPLPGVKEFIETCRKKGLKLAVATSADRVKMEINLREMDIPESTFDATISGSEVVNKKPDPEIFLKAAAKLGLKPQECLVVEDAVNGIKAGKAAGCKCLGLTTSFSTKELKEADWIAKDLSAVPKEVIQLFCPFLPSDAKRNQKNF